MNEFRDRKITIRCPTCGVLYHVRGSTRWWVAEFHVKYAKCPNGHYRDKEMAETYLGGLIYCEDCMSPIDPTESLSSKCYYCKNVDSWKRHYEASKLKRFVILIHNETTYHRESS